MGASESKTSFERLCQEALEAPFSGWDFSFLDGRMSALEKPWSYDARVKDLISSASVMLDMGTGGGERLSTYAPLPPTTYATERYSPNIPVAQKRLASLGVQVVFEERRGEMPFDDNTFDLIINRHTSFDAGEIYRILKPGGRFLTQQVGGANNLQLNKLLTGRDKAWHWSLDLLKEQLINTGMKVVESKECFPEQRCYDIGAVVFYLRVIPWQVSGYHFEACRDRLFEIHQMIERDGYLAVTSHRFLIEAIKPAAKFA